jgi:hypothetical protein
VMLCNLRDVKVTFVMPCDVRIALCLQKGKEALCMGVAMILIVSLRAAA